MTLTRIAAHNIDLKKFFSAISDKSTKYTANTFAGMRGVFI